MPSNCPPKTQTNISSLWKTQKLTKTKAVSWKKKNKIKKEPVEDRKSFFLNNKSKATYSISITNNNK